MFALARQIGDALAKSFGGESVFAPGMELDDKKVWARSLVEFFELGAKLQKECKRPSVYISW